MSPTLVTVTEWPTADAFLTTKALLVLNSLLSKALVHQPSLKRGSKAVASWKTSQH